MNYRTDRNNYHRKPKLSTIYTPKEVSNFIYGLLTPYFLPEKEKPILDPCSGQNSLLIPWQKAGYQIWGNDNNSQLLKQQIPDSDLDFLTSEKFMWSSYFNNQKPALILCNPPFNGYGNKLGSEVWLDKIIELFGKEVPIVLFVPIGFRLNLTLESPRHKKLATGIYPPIASQITLPKNIFEKVIFHSEILIFNIPNLQSHYFFNHHEETT